METEAPTKYIEILCSKVKNRTVFLFQFPSLLLLFPIDSYFIVFIVISYSISLFRVVVEIMIRELVVLPSFYGSTFSNYLVVVFNLKFYSQLGMFTA